MPPRVPRPRGFAWAELLIIVVLVGLVAAIGSAQFKESQARARHSQVLRDFREMRTAVAIYKADHLAFPRHTWGCPPIEDFVEGERSWWSLTEQITTPVAYLQSVRRDPFMEDRSQFAFERFYGYETYQWSIELLLTSVGFCPIPGGPTINAVAGGATYLRAHEEYLGNYHFWSAGPAGLRTALLNAGRQYVAYDPSNGAMSSGHIFVGERMPEPRYVPANNFY